MDSTDFETFNSPAGGVELSDTLSDWRLKTNGIIEKIDAIDSSTSDGTALAANAVTFAKIEQVASKKLLGNTGGSDSNISEIDIVEESGGIGSNDVDTKIPSSAAVKDYVDNKFFDGQIVQQKIARVNTVANYESEILALQTSGTYNGKYITSTNNVLVHSNPASSGSMHAVRIPVDISITPTYANSLICIEWHVFGEGVTHNAGFWIGRKRSDNKYEVIEDTGYEGYNPTASFSNRNNFYHPHLYNDNNGSTPNMHVVRYFIDAVDTTEKTFSLIAASAIAGFDFSLNSARTINDDYDHEKGVSNITIKELYQV